MVSRIDQYQIRPIWPTAEDGVQAPIEISLPRERSCSALARRVIERHFSQLARESLDELRLVASELVDNAYLHGRREIRLTLRRMPDAVRLEVMDEGRGARVQIRRPGTAEGGNGLRLVDHLCREWGSFEGSTHVWAELPVRTRAA